jgi:hypothetical protein
MADRYLITGGGSVNWNSTGSWSATDGGATGASFPVAGDNVFLTAASGAGTLTINVTSACGDFTTTGYTGTLVQNTDLNIGGSMTLAASGWTWTNNAGSTVFNATTTGKTVVTNGKTISGTVDFNGTGGGWTMSGDTTVGSICKVTAGALVLTSGKTLQCGNFQRIGTATASFDMSGGTVTIVGAGSWNITSATGFTLTVDTSSSIGGVGSVFAGAGLTYNDVTVSYFTIMSGANTFRDLTINGPGTTGNYFQIAGSITVTGTISFSGTSASNRATLMGSTVGTQVTITAAAVSFTDVDFRDIAGAGAAAPFTGTRIGDLKGNSGITFTAGVNKYWVGNTGNWNSTSWATTSGGAAAANNYPLPQDTAIFDANSFSANGQGVLLNANGSYLPGIDFSGITKTGITFNNASANVTLGVMGDVVFSANNGTIGGTYNTFPFAGRSATQLITTAGKTVGIPISVDSFGGTLKFADNYTSTAGFTYGEIGVTRGTLDLNGKAVSCNNFTSSGTNARTLTDSVGGASLTLTGNNGGIWNTVTATNLTVDASWPTVVASYSGATGARQFNAAATESVAVSLNVTAGTDAISFSTGGGVKNLDFTGFTGSLATGTTMTVYGNLTLSSGMSVAATTNAITFGATSGTKTFTSAGLTVDRPITVNGAGGTVQLGDNLTLGSTRTLTLTAGTLDLGTKTASVGRFSSSGSTARTLTFGTGGKISTTDTTTATVFDCTTGTNLTVNRTGGAIDIGGNTTNTRTFAGGGKTWPTVTFTNTTAAGRLDFTGSNTFKSLAYSGGTAQTVGFTAGTTTTIEDDNGFFAGTAGNVITIASITAASHTLAKSGGGLVSMDYLSVSRSTATPSSTWCAGHHSTNGGNNSGWSFTGDCFPCAIAAAALSFAGSIATALNPIITRAFTATLSFAGATVRAVRAARTATLSYVGAVAKRATTARAAALSFAAAAAKRTGKAAAGALSFVGAYARLPRKALAATLSLAGVSARLVRAARTATLSYVGAAARRTTRSTSAILSFTGVAVRRAGKAAAGVLSFSGVQARRSSRATIAALPLVGSAARGIARPWVATLSFAGSVLGSVVQLVLVALASALALSGAVSTASRRARELAATLAFSTYAALGVPRVLLAGRRWAQALRSATWAVSRRRPPQ